MSYAPQPMQPVSIQKPPKSKVTLYLGLVCFFIALLGLVLIFVGSSRISSGVGNLADQATNLDPANDPTRTVVDLNVPGETVCSLQPDEYVIWAKVPPDAINRGEEQEDSDVESAAPEVPEPDFSDWENGDFGQMVDLPEVKWTVLDESQIEVPVNVETSGFFADEILAGHLTIHEPGSYTIRAEIEELPPGYSFRLCDDVTEEQLEQAAKSVGSVAGGFMLIFAGGAMAGLFGLIGLILLIVYLVT